MVDFLAAVGAGVYDAAIAACRNAFFFSDLAGHDQQVAQSVAVGGLRFLNAGDGFFRDDEDMGGRLRIDIVKGEYLVIFVYLLGRNLSVDDLAEQTIHAVLLGWLRVRSVTALPAV